MFGRLVRSGMSVGCITLGGFGLTRDPDAYRAMFDDGVWTPAGP